MDASGAGRGVLSASVRAAGQEVKHAVHELDAGQYQVVYHPKLAVPHRIDLKYNGLHTAGNRYLLFLAMICSIVTQVRLAHYFREFALIYYDLILIETATVW